MNNGGGVAERGREVVFPSEAPHLIRSFPESLRQQRAYLSARSRHHDGTLSPGHTHSLPALFFDRKRRHRDRASPAHHWQIWRAALTRAAADSDVVPDGSVSVNSRIPHG